MQLSIVANVKYCHMYHLYPRRVSTLKSGLTLFVSELASHNQQYDYLIGGPIEIICAETGSKQICSDTINQLSEMAERCRFPLSKEINNVDLCTPEFDDTDGESKNELSHEYLKVDLKNIIQPNLVSVRDCLNADAPRVRKSNRDPETTLVDRSAPLGNQVASGIKNVMETFKGNSGLTELCFDINYVMQVVNLMPRCADHLNCKACNSVDPFESLNINDLKENHILSKCLRFQAATWTYYHYLPFKMDPYKSLICNRFNAEQTLKKMMKKLAKASPEDRLTISTSFNKLVTLGHIKMFSELDPSLQNKINNKPLNWFVPWNVVFKDSKSTPARIVFNASQKTGKYSLNCILYRGNMKAKLKLLGALFNFSANRVAISTDISKFYNCLKLFEDNWNFQNILWCPEMAEDGQIIRYVVTTCIYGVSSASCLTEQMFNHMASQIKNDSTMYWILSYGRYVDDIFASVSTHELAREIKTKITDFLGKYKVICKGWAISGEDPDEAVSENGVIGVGGYPFYVKADTLAIKVPLLDFSGSKSRGQLLNSKFFEGSTLEELNEFVPKKLTLRMALSKTSSIFDPRGIIAPFFLLTKMAFQDSIQSLGGFGDEILDESTKKVNKKHVLTAKMWDLALPEKQRAEWVRLLFMAEQIREFRFPRFPIPADVRTDECHLFGFGDAAMPGSQECVYLAFTNDGNCFHLVSLMTKNQVHSTRVAVKIPYKEMTALAITSALLQKCYLALPNVKGMKLFGDSEISLHWVKDNGPDINNFIRGRCQIVRNYVELDSIYHIRTNHNCSDTGTRRIKSVAEISPTSSFYLGPDCLRDFQKSIDTGIITPISDFNRDFSNNQHEIDARINKTEFTEEHIVSAVTLLGGNIEPVQGEMHKIELTDEEEENLLGYVQECIDDVSTEQILDAYINALSECNIKPKRLEKFKLSSDFLGQIEKRYNCWFKICQVAGFVLRACCLFSGRKNISLAENIQAAKIALLQSCMSKTKLMLKEKPLKDFIQTIDENGLVKVQTRVSQSNQNPSSLIVLSPSLALTKKILYSFHCLTHSGVKASVAKSRLFYWIPQAGKLMKPIKRNCIKCRLLDAEALTQLMAPVPPFRLHASPPWYHTMLDLFGPIEVRGFVHRRTFRKTWGVIFTCLNSRAVWCYLAESYSTRDLINVIRKHECRNGSARIYFSDLGSQIVGADKAMDDAIEHLNKGALEGFTAKRNSEFKFGVPYHSQGQGAVERLIKEVKRYLKILMKGTFTFAETECILAECSQMINSRPLQYYPKAGEDGFLCPNDILFGRSSQDPPLLDFDNSNLVKKVTEKEEIMKEFWKKWSSSYLQSLHRYQTWKTEERNITEKDIVLVLDKRIAPGRFLMAEVESVEKGKDGLVRRTVLKYKVPDREQNKTRWTKYKRFVRSPHGLSLLLAAEERVSEDPAASVEDLELGASRFPQQRRNIVRTGSENNLSTSSFSKVAPIKKCRVNLKRLPHIPFAVIGGKVRRIPKKN